MRRAAFTLAEVSECLFVSGRVEFFTNVCLAARDSGKREDGPGLMDFTFQMAPSQRQEPRGEEVVQILASCHPIMSWQDTEMKNKCCHVQIHLHYNSQDALQPQTWNSCWEPI